MKVGVDKSIDSAFFIVVGILIFCGPLKGSMHIIVL